MSLELLSLPRMTGSADQNQRVLEKWLTDLHTLLSDIDIANRLGRAETVLGTISDLGELSQAISNPPTQAEVTAVQDKVNSIIAAAALPTL